MATTLRGHRLAVKLPPRMTSSALYSYGAIPLPSHRPLRCCARCWRMSQFVLHCTRWHLSTKRRPGRRQIVKAPIPAHHLEQQKEPRHAAIAWHDPRYTACIPSSGSRRISNPAALPELQLTAPAMAKAGQTCGSAPTAVSSRGSQSLAAIVAHPSGLALKLLLGRRCSACSSRSQA